MFNGSVFTLKVGEPKFVAQLGQTRLRMKSTLESTQMTVAPGNSTVLQFTQPMNAGSAKRLKDWAEQKEQVHWEFRLDCEYEVQEYGIEARFAPEPFRRLEIPMAR